MSSVLNSLTQFDYEKHYIRVNGNQLIICNKSDLGWVARFTRFFWKPENERIEAVAKAIFNLPADGLCGMSKGDEQQLTYVFLQLIHLSEKADLKLKNTSYRQMVFRMQNVSFESLGVHKKSQEIDKKKSEFEQELEKKRTTAESKNTLLTTEIEQKEATLESYATQIQEQKELLQKTKGEVENEKLAYQDVLSFISTTKTSKACLLLEIAKLQQQKNYLTSDTVIWTDDGYSLASSSIFNANSMLNSGGFSKHVGRSEIIEQRLTKLAEEETEKSEQLKMLPKHIYLENARRQDVQLLLQLLENGPSFAPEYTDEQYQRICAIADYLQQSHPANVRGAINRLVKELRKKEAEAKKHAEENAQLKAKLKNKSTTVQTRNRQAARLRHYIQLGQTKRLDDEVQQHLQNMSRDIK
jgi:hypothetical protein